MEIGLKSQPLQQGLQDGDTKKKRQPVDMMKGTITSLEGRLSKLGKIKEPTNQINPFFLLSQTAADTTNNTSEAMDTTNTTF